MNRLINILTAAYVLLSLLTLSGCTGNESSAFSNIAPDGWVYGDTVYFTPGENTARHLAGETDTTKTVTGDLSVVVRHNNNYEYSNLWLELSYQAADTIVTDTLNIRLADDFGNWLGKGIGISFQQEQPVLKDVTIATGSQIKVTHIMRVDTLADIEQVGILFTPKLK